MGENSKEVLLEKDGTANNKIKRRDFVVLTASGIAGAGVVAAAFPLLHSLSPAKDALALATVEVNISAVKPGQSMIVKWQGKPVFIKNRTNAEIKSVRNVDIKHLHDPQRDEDRVIKGKDNWLITIGVCTHLGCVPMGTKEGDNKGDFGGYFCPCHGSHYDASGRIRRGPAPKNLIVPEYYFLDNNVIVIGESSKEA